MKNFVTFILLFLISLFSNTLSSQVIYNHKIDSIVNLVSLQSITKMNRELSRDTIVNTGRIPQILFSRYRESIGNVKASQYISIKLS
jgi:hypothetical protein